MTKTVKIPLDNVGVEEKEHWWLLQKTKKTDFWDLGMWWAVLHAEGDNKIVDVSREQSKNKCVNWCIIRQVDVGAMH